MSITLSPKMEKYNEYSLALYCPGCEMMHLVYLQHPDNTQYPTWSWNGDVNAPTFSPSLLVKYNWGENREERVCHSFIRHGQWEFLGDCTHKLRGLTVPVPNIPENV